jgi:hypothetical protein
MKTLIASGLFAIAILLCFDSCNKNSQTNKITPTCDGTASTYNSNIKTILDGACTSSGCHPQYASYAGLRGILGDGQFTSHVLTSQDMPRNSSLSADQLNKIKCWADAGFPEK